MLVKKEDGSHLRIPRCNYPRLLIDDGRSKVDGSGWQVFTVWDGGKDLTDYNGTWNVPTKPSSYNDQLLYTFTGLQNAFGDEEQGVDIIQPVLQYGVGPAGGGAYWGIASWYVASSGAALHSTLQPVNDGDSIFGIMTKASATAEAWTITATDTTSGVTTTLNVNKKLGEFEPYAFVTLEVYSVTDCSQYPTDPLNYVNLIIDISKQPAVPKWQVQSQQQICKEAATVVSPTAVTITF